ncbi:hypothetical protein HDR63_03200 [bacterium]|nr:hypothetical protein [bacterium]
MDIKNKFSQASLQCPGCAAHCAFSYQQIGNCIFPMIGGEVVKVYTDGASQPQFVNGRLSVVGTLDLAKHIATCCDHYNQGR